MPVGWKERWEGEQDVAKGENKSSSPAGQPPGDG